LDSAQRLDGVVVFRPMLINQKILTSHNVL
jgi:hypothetical protein